MINQVMGGKKMKRRLLVIGMLLALLLSASGCESELDKAERKAAEARQKAIEAQQQLDLLETLFGK